MTELIIDSFAGGGGASLGISLALGRAPDVAINHDASAIAMHAANHPETKHCTEDVWKVSPHTVTKGKPVGLLWASPDCCHFSRAKGAKPVKKEIRSLAWVVVKRAAEVRPRVIILENVREFEDWGPLIEKKVGGKVERLPDGSPVLIPDPTRKGHSFRRWAGRLRNLGYEVQWRVLNASDYGAPTHRRRLFLVARCDGERIVWPEPTHGDPKKIEAARGGLFPVTLKPCRTAASCIDWSIPCPSIFTRKRPLAENTLRRIAMGIKRYVLDNATPFIVSVDHSTTTGRGKYADGLDEPLKTVTASNGKAVVAPVITPLTHNGKRRSHPPTEPLPTVTSAHRGEFALIAPAIASLAHGGNGTFGDSRAHDVREPVRTVHAGGNNHALVAAFLAKHFGGVVGQTADKPASTITARDHHSLVAANCVRLNHGEKQWSAADEPLRAVTASGNHAALVYSFLTKYYATAIGQAVTDPLHAATANDRFGLVTVTIDGEPYVITDIGMRMLEPRELARAQGFPDSYTLTGSKSNQVAKIGNSVCPVMAQVLCAANYREAKTTRRKANKRA